MPKLFPKSDARATTTPTRRKRLFLSYAPDWAVTILLWGLFYLLDKIDGYRRLFDVTDTSLAHPYADPERVPVWLAGVLCGAVPAILIILVAAFERRSFWDGHNGLLGLILGLGLTVTFTNIIKITAGRPRPDLFARCILPPTLTSNPTHSLTSWTACTTTDKHRLQEGFRSFPSGHSSFAWCGMWYLILYLAAKMRINNRQGFTYKSWLLLAPLSCASLITVSRTMDYRHHATDVIAGSLIGVAGGWYSYRQYYPPLSHPQAYKPHSPRIPRDDPSLPLHHHHHPHHPSSPSSHPGRDSQEVMLKPLPPQHLNANGNGQHSPFGGQPGFGGRYQSRGKGGGGEGGHHQSSMGTGMTSSSGGVIQEQERQQEQGQQVVGEADLGARGEMVGR
ncbi:hypothetical protein L202_01836 [Cryptococcus amylolentus CBS 6039]|uniref:Phosphatidic acid phosphatase type 2/haloperoxidase domain-containing protein n=2 Tax=Cryptococcus amylolentus TaxID=104669 RepID=A0A1E3I4Z5_9TREE|nr:hypothetical protein L202_01836 [Cryptococcus amylolentus CBS 6039]ODN83744.1 hypothetical protein L202_01836 [Cryptococcus amylolentus CBS 6039]ODO11210.1 hypothetical protein I350_01814 [Cryptococcus amylolentus CBS 6273]